MATVANPHQSNRQFLQQNKTFNLGILLAKRHHYFDAFDRFKLLLQNNAKLLPDVLIPLYKQLMIHDEDLQLRVLIAELYMVVEWD